MNFGFLKYGGTSARCKLYTAVLGVLSNAAYALPQGGEVVAGEAQIDAAGSQMDVHQSSDRVILEYDSFNVDAHERVNFHQPNTDSVALNRVLGNDLSQIHGQINANGEVFLINPNGVLYGQGAQINVGGLVTTTLDIENQDFLQGREAFAGSDEGTVANHGHIRADRRALLIAPEVINSGNIEVPTGEIALHSSRNVLVQPEGSEIALLVEDPELVGRIHNEGLLSAQRVTLSMDAAGEQALYDSVIHNEGLVRASRVAQQGGEIQLLGPGADVINSGTLDASGATGQGGRVEVAAQRFAHAGSIKANAQGTGGGGEIHVEVDDTLVLHQGSGIEANADTTGAGGEVVVYSHNATWYRDGASIQARGGRVAGNGGFVEVSGHQQVTIEESVDVGAANGTAGTWYIDPTDIVVGNFASSGGSFNLSGGEYLWNLDSPNPATSQINYLALQDTLVNNGDVILDTASAAGGSGNITFNLGIDYNGAPTGRTITLRADNDIIFNSGAGFTDSTPGDHGLNIVLDAGSQVLMNSDTYLAFGSGSLTATTGGNVTLLNNASMLGGGDVALDVGGNFSMAPSAVVETGEGTFDLAADGNISLASVTSLSTADDAISILSQNGQILDDFDPATGLSATSGGILLQAATGIANVGLDTSRLGVRNTVSGDVTLARTGDLTLTSLGVGDNMVMDIAATGALTYTGSLGSNLDGASNSTIRLSAGNGMAISGDLSDTTGAVDHSVTFDFDAGSGFTMTDGVTVDAGGGRIDIAVSNGGASVTGLSSLNSADDAINIAVDSGQLNDAGDARIDIRAVNGGTAITAPDGVVDLETDVVNVAIIAANGSIAINELNDLNVRDLSANDVVQVTTGGDFILPGTATSAGNSLLVEAEGNIVLPNAGLTRSGTLALTGNDIDDEAGSRALTLGATDLTLNTASSNGDVDFAVTADNLDIGNFGGNTVTVTDADGLNLVAATPASGTTVVNTSAGQDLVISNDIDLHGTSGALALNAAGDLRVDASLRDTTGIVDNSTQLTLAAANGLIFVPNAVVDAGAADVALTAQGGDIALGDVRGGSLSLASAGAVTDANGTAVNLTGDVAQLASATAVGTAVDPLETSLGTLNFTGIAGPAFLTNDGNLTLGALDIAGNLALAVAAGDLTLTETVSALGGNAEFVLADGTLVVPDAGFSMAGNLTLAAQDIRDSDRTISLAAGDADLTFAALAADTQLNTDFDALALTNASANGISVVDANALDLVNLTSGGDASVTTTDADLDVSASALNVAGELGLNTQGSGNLVVADAGLVASGDLAITADNLLDSDTTVSLAATDANINLRDGSAAHTWNTDFDTLVANIAGAGDLNITDADGLTVQGLSAGGNVGIATTAADLTMAVATSGVAGELRLRTLGSGDVRLLDGGFDHGGALVVDADAIVDSDRTTAMTATDAQLSLRSVDQALRIDSGFDQLQLTAAGPAGVAIANDRALVLSGLQASSDASVTANGDLTVTTPVLAVDGRASLTAAGTGQILLTNSGLTTPGALYLEADSLADDDRNLLLDATDLSLYLRNLQADQSVVSSADILDLTAAGPGQLVVAQQGAVEVRGLTADGNLNLVSSDQIILTEANAEVGGTLTIDTDGDLVLATAGLVNQGDLDLSAQALRDNDYRVTLGGGTARVNLSGGFQQQLDTSFDELALVIAGGASTLVNDVDALRVTQVESGGDVTLQVTDADLTMATDRAEVAGDLALTTLGSGRLVLSDTGLSTAQGLIIDVDDVVDSDREVALEATAADIRLRALAGDSTWTTGFDRLAWNSGGDSGVVAVNNNRGLEVTALDTAQAFSLAAAGDLLMAAESSSVAGALTLAADGNLVVPTAGFSVADGLVINADNITNAEGGADAQLAARTANITLRDGAVDAIWSTQFEQLGLTYGGSNLTVNNAGALDLSALTAGGPLSVNTGAGDLTLSGQSVAVDGRLNLAAPEHNLVITQLTHTDWVAIDAANLVAPGGGAVGIEALGLALNLSGSESLALQSSLSRLDVNFASAGAFELANAGDLIVEGLQLPAAERVDLNVDGTLMVPATGLSAAGRLAIDADDLIDDDRRVSLAATDLAVSLTAAAGESTLDLAVQRLDALIAGRADLSLNDSDGLTLADLNGDGRALSVANGNLNLRLQSGDLAIESDVLASDLSADGTGSGRINLTADAGNITVGATHDVLIRSDNSLDQTDAGVGITLRLTDASDASRAIVLGNGADTVELTAVGGDIVLDARPQATAEGAQRSVVQNLGVGINAYNSIGDPLTGAVFVNGRQVTPSVGQRIGAGRRLTIVSDREPVEDSVFDEVDTPEDSVPDVDTDEGQNSVNVDAQFAAVFGRCNELDKQDAQRCRVDEALKSFLSHWLIGGELPPKTPLD